ncbi:MAG: RDD family protein [Flavisolibacter sp.]|jgi:uncharacterized RDD family membrane protein YckC|nr:RDD family protein [Flavisolibacter sp.]
MSIIHVNTNFNIDLEFEAAPFYKRLFAWMIDSFLLIIYMVMAIRFINSIGESVADQTYHALFMIAILPFFVYHLICEITLNGQSIGKKIFGIRVVNENGGQPGNGQFVIRWLIRTSDYMVLVIILFAPSAAASGDSNFFWQVAIPFGLLTADVILVNSKKQQRLGDLLAHTLVIDATRSSSINETVFLEIEKNYKPSFPQVMQLSDRDINSLKGILDTARKRHDYDLADMASEKIKRHLKIDTTLSPFDFLEVLLKDYNYLSSN